MIRLTGGSIFSLIERKKGSWISAEINRVVPLVGAPIDFKLEILKVRWNQTPLAVRDVRERLEETAGRKVSHSSVITMLNSMVRNVVAIAAVICSLWAGSAVWSQNAVRNAPKAIADESPALPIQPIQEPDRHPVVTGQVLLPDGSPAADVVIMTATDRFGWGEGLTNGNYTKTDENGRYRIISKRWFPQRLFWLPQGYENNSRAVENTGGEQKPIRLQRARRIRGIATDFDGKPVPDIFIRASGASRTPMTWAKTNEQGEFEFRPLPAGEYNLQPVRSYHDHVTGQLKFHKLPIPFNNLGYQLKSEGDVPLAKIIAPETVSIRVNVVDGEGQPITREHVSIGDIGDYSNALIADEVRDQPGMYEFKFPKGRYIRDLKLRHSWSEIAYYQEKPGVDPIPAEAIVLNKANKDIDGIKVIVRPSATLLVQLQHPSGEPYVDETPGFSVSVTHPESSSPSDRSTVTLQPAHFIPRNQVGIHEFKGVIPNCDVRVQVRGDDVNEVTNTVRLSEGETRTIELVVREKTTAVLRGEIITENGQEVKKKGWLYSRSTTRDQGGNSRSYTSTEGHFAKEFSVTVEAGTIVLSLYTPGFAPAWIGPLETKPKDIREDLKMVLRRGFSFPIQIRDTDGDPVAGAKFFAHPEINGEIGGPNFEQVADNQGNYLLQHAADTRYQFRVSAPGFETLRTEPIEIAADKLLTLTLRQSQLTRGVIKTADGSPAASAKIFLVAQQSAEGKTLLSGGDFGDVIGKTDEQGHFELDQLQLGASYLMLIESENRARMLAYDIKAGEDDIELAIPTRRDLRIRILGDTNLLLHRREKPFIGVRQHVAVTRENPNMKHALGDDVFVTFTKEGGLALYQGLVSGTVRVSAGKQSQTVEVNEDGVTEVMFRFVEAKAEDKPD